MEQQLAMSAGVFGSVGILSFNTDTECSDDIRESCERHGLVSSSTGDKKELLNRSPCTDERSNVLTKQTRTSKKRGFTMSMYFDTIKKSSMDSMRQDYALADIQANSSDTSRRVKCQRRSSKLLNEKTRHDIKSSLFNISKKSSTIGSKSSTAFNLEECVSQNTVSTNFSEGVFSAQLPRTKETGYSTEIQDGPKEKYPTDERVMVLAIGYSEAVMGSAIYPSIDNVYQDHQASSNLNATACGKHLSPLISTQRVGEDFLTSPSEIILAACAEAYSTIKIIAQNLVSDIEENNDSDYSNFGTAKYDFMDRNRSSGNLSRTIVLQRPKRHCAALSQILEWSDLRPSTDEAPAFPSIPGRQLVAAKDHDAIIQSKSKRKEVKSLPFISPYFTPPTSASKEKRFREDVILKPKILSKTQEAREAECTIAVEPPSKSNGVNKQKIGVVSCIPFPPLSSPFFGLIQERLAENPFRLLIAITFLNRTHGKYAIPVFFELIEKYPTPESLAYAKKEDIIEIIRNLGLQRKRAKKYQTYANMWLENPPTKGKRYAVKDYPMKGDGKNVDKDEIISDEDERVAWELGHITQGRYAIDSWRIFCRDVLRGKAKSWNGEGSTEENFQPEWMRVLPEDKELRAYLRWMWLKEGFEWDPFTGEKEVASKGLMQAAIEGNIAWDDQGGMRIIDSEEQGAK